MMILNTKKAKSEHLINEVKRIQINIQHVAHLAELFLHEGGRPHYIMCTKYQRIKLFVYQSNDPCNIRFNFDY